MAYQGGAKPVAQLHKTYPSTCGENAYAAIEPTKRLFAAARSAGIPIFYTTQDTRPDSLPSRVTATKRQSAPQDPSLYAIKSEFKPQPGDVVITKQRASGFYGTPLMAHLTQLGIQTVIVCGESTSGCVRASAVDAYSNGFHVVRGRGMLLRPQHAVAQGQPVRHAPQIHRRDARRRSGDASQRSRGEESQLI